MTLSVNQWKRVKLQEELIYVNALGFAFCSRTVWEEKQTNQDEWWKEMNDAIEDVVSLPNASKTLHNGQLLIRRGDKTYDAQGREIK